jgi:hypothetical protein
MENLATGVYFLRAISIGGKEVGPMRKVVVLR